MTTFLHGLKAVATIVYQEKSIDGIIVHKSNRAEKHKTKRVEKRKMFQLQ